MDTAQVTIALIQARHALGLCLDPRLAWEYVDCARIGRAIRSEARTWWALARTRAGTPIALLVLTIYGYGAWTEVAPQAQTPEVVAAGLGLGWTVLTGYLVWLGGRAAVRTVRARINR